MVTVTPPHPAASNAPTPKLHLIDRTRRSYRKIAPAEIGSLEVRDAQRSRLMVVQSDVAQDTATRAASRSAWRRGGDNQR